jgi:hypothetical protein
MPGVAGFAQYNREEREKKEIHYRDLLTPTDSLKQYADEVNMLSVLEERNRIARNIIHEALAKRHFRKNGLRAGCPTPSPTLSCRLTPEAKAQPPRRRRGHLSAGVYSGTAKS